MTYYLELNEQLTGGEELTKQPENLRLKIADTSVSEEDATKTAAEVLESLKDLWAHTDYTARLVICRHDTGESCSVVELGDHKAEETAKTLTVVDRLESMTLKAVDAYIAKPLKQ